MTIANLTPPRRRQPRLDGQGERLSITLPPELHRRLVADAERFNVTLAYMAMAIIQKHYEGEASLPVVTVAEVRL